MQTKLQSDIWFGSVICQANGTTGAAVPLHEENTPVAFFLLSGAKNNQGLKHF